MATSTRQLTLPVRHGTSKESGDTPAVRPCLLTELLDKAIAREHIVEWRKESSHFHVSSRVAEGCILVVFLGLWWRQNHVFPSCFLALAWLHAD
jgi:hypothetical protein